MTLWKDKGRWYARIMVRGAYYTPGQGYDTKREAETAQLELRFRLKGTPTPQRSFYSYVQEYLDRAKTFNSKGWYDAKRYIIYSQFVKWFDRHPSNIRRDEVESHLAQRSQLSARSARLDLEVLRNFYHWLRASQYWGEQGVFPTDGIRIAVRTKRLASLPSAEEVQKLFDKNRGPDLVLLGLLAFTCGRISEIRRLRWEDIDLSGRTITLRTRKSRDGSEVARVLPLVTPLWVILKSQPEQEGYVLKSRGGKSYHDLRKKLWKCYANAGLARPKRPFHSFRHLGASLMMQAGESLKVVQEILGHTTLNTTNIYLQVPHANKVQAMKALEGLIKFDKKSEKGQE